MFRFTIRDVLWLMVMVAIVVTWRLEVVRLIRQREAAIAKERWLGEVRTKESIDRILGRYIKPIASKRKWPLDEIPTFAAPQPLPFP